MPTMEQPRFCCALLPTAIDEKVSEKRKLLLRAANSRRAGGNGDAQPDDKQKAFSHEDSPAAQQGPREAVPLPSFQYCQPQQDKKP